MQATYSWLTYVIGAGAFDVHAMFWANNLNKDVLNGAVEDENGVQEQCDSQNLLFSTVQGDLTATDLYISRKSAPQSMGICLLMPSSD